MSNNNNSSETLAFVSYAYRGLYLAKRNAWIYRSAENGQAVYVLATKSVNETVPSYSYTFPEFRAALHALSMFGTLDSDAIWWDRLSENEREIAQALVS